MDDMDFSLILKMFVVNHCGTAVSGTTFWNFLSTGDVEDAYNESRYVLCPDVCCDGRIDIGDDIVEDEYPFLLLLDLRYTRFPPRDLSRM